MYKFYVLSKVAIDASAKSPKRVIPKAQVRTYLQWVKWLFDAVINGKPYVIVNMDGTSVSNLTSMKAGCVAKGGRKPGGRARERKPDRDSADLKTTLLGTACSDPLLQPRLPQVLLPKYAPKKKPPQEIGRIL